MSSHQCRLHGWNIAPRPVRTSYRNYKSAPIHAVSRVCVCSKTPSTVVNYHYQSYFTPNLRPRVAHRLDTIVHLSLLRLLQAYLRQVRAVIDFHDSRFAFAFLEIKTRCGGVGYDVPEVQDEEQITGKRHTRCQRNMRCQAANR